MSDWIPIHKGGDLFDVVEEMASGLGSTVGLPGEQFRAWFHVHAGTYILIAGEGTNPELWALTPPPDGVVRILRRGSDGSSVTLDNGGTPYWDKLSPKDQAGATLTEALDAVSRDLADRLELPLEPLN